MPERVDYERLLLIMLNPVIVVHQDHATVPQAFDMRVFTQLQTITRPVAEPSVGIAAGPRKSLQEHPIRSYDSRW